MGTASLSIVIPTYNRSDMLRQTLESIGGQTFLPDNLEVVVSDDCSQDDTKAVLDEYQCRWPFLKVFHQTQNLRHAKNWEFLLSQATGELVYLLCDDDAIAPDFLESYLTLFRNDPNLDMVFGDIELRGPQFDFQAPLPLPTPEGPSDGPLRCREQLRSHHMVMSTVYRKSTLLAAGGWDATVGSHLDCTAFCRTALRARRTYHLARPMFYFRLSPGSWSHKLSTENQRQLAQWYRRKLDLLVDDARVLAPELLPFLDEMYLWHAKTVLGYLEIELGSHRLRGGQLRAAMRGLLNVFPEARYDRLTWKVWLVSAAGTGWLTMLRKVLGKPDPYRSTLALFNSFPPSPPPAPSASATASH
jgi:glycosyltransferase involved in cell wall biosynthesis